MAYEAKTKPTDANVDDFLAAVENTRRRADAAAICALLSEVSGERPVMWGPTIVGFGAYKGPTGDWPVLGFSPRKANLVLYGLGSPHRDELLARLGKHKTGGGCIYLTSLAGVNMAVLREMAAEGLAATRAKFSAPRGEGVQTRHPS